MLSTTEALSFVTGVLGVWCPSERPRSDPFTLLHKIIKAFHGKIPFQSLSLLAVPPKERLSAPSMDEIKRSVTSGLGGLCYTLNTFMKFLLEALGYEVYHVVSSIGQPDNHILSVVQNVRKPGDKFLVDVGTGYPTFEPIPLDFADESPVYKHSFLVFKFSWMEGMLVRCHHTKQTDLDGWRKVCIIDPTPRELAYFQEPMDIVYSDPSRTPFHTSLRVVSFPNGKAVCIRDSCLLVENDCQKMVEEPLADRREILAKVNDLFPLLGDAVLLALENLKMS